LQGVIEVGGFSEVWSVNEKWDRIEFFELVNLIYSIFEGSDHLTSKVGAMF